MNPQTIAPTAATIAHVGKPARVRRPASYAAASARYAPDAREVFAARTMEHNAAIAVIKLTVPQRRALDVVAADNRPGVPIHRGSVLTDSMFSKLDALGLVVADADRLPHRARLSPLGMAYTRRAPKGGKR